MNPINNPFSPGAGSPPPELVGRDEVIEQARILLGRIRSKKAEKSLLLTGLRGVGKTVLLNEMERIAKNEGYHCILVEAQEGKPLSTLLAPHIRTLLFELDRKARMGNKVRRGLGVLKSFVGAIKVTYADIEFGLDIEPERGTADSGDLEIDFPNMLVALAEAAEEQNTFIAILIDEVQYFTSVELSALIMAMHKMQQRQLPLVLLGAGFPILPGLAGESKSYAERLFSFPDIGPLPAPFAAQALQEPVKALGVEFEDAALDEVFRLTRGYPYFLQEWGYQAWNHATHSPITLQDIHATTEKVSQRLDKNFFRVRFDRLTPSEKNYLRAMAELGVGPYRTSDIAAVLNVKVTSLGPVRAKLIKKGMIYSPTHGNMAYTVPLFAEFMRSVIPEFVTR